MSIIEISSVISAIIVSLISIFNLFLGFKIYKFNKKNAYSKISLLPVQKKLLDTDYRTEEVINFHLFFQKEKEKLNSNEGFPSISLSSKDRNEKVWRIQISNKGDFVSTNIKLDFSVVVKKAEILFGKDENGKKDKTNVISHEIVDFMTYNKIIEIPYMGSEQIKEIAILNYDGEYPEADLVINKLTCDQNDFIKKSVKIDEIKHPEFDRLEDAPHLLKMLGLY